MSEDEIAELVTKTEQSMNTQKKMFDGCYPLFQLFEEYLQKKDICCVFWNCEFERKVTVLKKVYEDVRMLRA